MPYCPQCRFEYRQEVSICPDCNVPLVQELPQSRQSSPDERPHDWTPIVSLTSQQYASMVIEALHNSDIPAVLVSSAGHFGQTGQMGISSFRPMGGAYTVAVPRDNLTEADQIGESILGDVWVKGRLIEIDDDVA